MAIFEQSDYLRAAHAKLAARRQARAAAQEAAAQLQAEEAAAAWSELFEYVQRLIPPALFELWARPEEVSPDMLYYEARFIYHEIEFLQIALTKSKDGWIIAPKKEYPINAMEDVSSFLNDEGNMVVIYDIGPFAFAHLDLAAAAGFEQCQLYLAACENAADYNAKRQTAADTDSNEADTDNNEAEISFNHGRYERSIAASLLTIAETLTDIRDIYTKEG